MYCATIAIYQSIILQDVNVLMDIVEGVSPTMPPESESESEDDEEKMKRYKENVKNHTITTLKILCIWDCTNIWIKISEVLAFIVFDPFTELIITICIAVNVIFMALDQYDENYDDNGGMSPFLTELLINGNYFFTAIFAVESFAKMAAMSPRYFFAVSLYR